MVLLRTSQRLARPLAQAARQQISPLAQAGAARTLSATANRQGKVLMVLYDVSSNSSRAAEFQEWP